MPSLLVAASILVPAFAADTAFDDPSAPVHLVLRAELGLLAPLAHHIQFGRQGTRFDYRREGGQDVLFPIVRLEAEGIAGRHHARLLFQPLDLRTSVTIEDDLRVDDTTFFQRTPMDLRYGFTFWRASWSFDLARKGDRELRLGLGLQLRNANIEFSAADGGQRVTNRNVGPVPLLSVAWLEDLDGWWFSAEADGVYAPVSYLNGDDNDVVGAILDSSLRAGLQLDHGFRPFLDLRYLGGGSTGASDEGPGDGYSKNWLHFLTLAVGAELR